VASKEKDGERPERVAGLEIDHTSPDIPISHFPFQLTLKITDTVTF